MGIGTESALFKVIETDRMTGWDRYLDNMKTSPWSGTFTRDEADACVDWRQKNITGRYGYKVVAVEPYMTDNEAARERHMERHGLRRMEDCGDIDCRAAAARIAHAEISRQYAATAEARTDA